MELGNATTLQWTSTNASTVTITPSPVAGSGMSGPQTVSASGSLTIIPTAINQSPGYTYTLTVTNNSCAPQTITKTTVVKVRPVFVPPPCPNVISFTADSCVASGGNSTLRWNVADSDFVTITGPGVNQTFSSSPIGTGSMTVTPTGDSTYTLIVPEQVHAPQPRRHTQQPPQSMYESANHHLLTALSLPPQ